MRIAVVAGEASGDQLGAGLISQLKSVFPNAEFYGIGGPLMCEQGFHSLYEMDDISMIGLEGVFTKLPEIIKIRRQLFNRFSSDLPDVFIGIDVPDFNLGLEKKLNRNGITCIHYVSPTIWAWRGYRIKTIKKAIAHMLVLFPFETKIYQQHGVPVTFVGHPIADEVDSVPDQSTCRNRLEIAQQGDVIALLPGSRTSEIHRHADLFISTAQILAQSRPDLKFIISAVNKNAEDYINQLLQDRHLLLDIQVVTKNVRDVISASDLVLAASGTVTLETALMGKPLVVAYKVSIISELMVRLFSNIDTFAMPNFLLDEPIIPEFIQQDATSENLSTALFKYLNNKVLRDETSSKFKDIKRQLKVDSNKTSANIVRSYLQAES